MIRLRELVEGDADILFPLIFKTPVTATILWDGPDSIDSYRKAMDLRQAQTRNGEAHFFVITEVSTNKPIGTITIRPEENKLRGDIGLWIGLPFQRKGYGTQAVKDIVKYGFEKLRLQKIEATVFLGNLGSRRIFEKNGFVLEGTIRKASLKRGKLIDEWLLGIVE